MSPPFVPAHRLLPVPPDVQPVSARRLNVEQIVELNRYKWGPQQSEHNAPFHFSFKDSKADVAGYEISFTRLGHRPAPPGTKETLFGGKHYYIEAHIKAAGQRRTIGRIKLQMNEHMRAYEEVTQAGAYIAHIAVLSEYHGRGVALNMLLYAFVMRCRSTPEKLLMDFNIYARVKPGSAAHQLRRSVGFQHEVKAGLYVEIARKPAIPPNTRPDDDLEGPAIHPAQLPRLASLRRWLAVPPQTRNEWNRAIKTLHASDRWKWPEEDTEASAELFFKRQAAHVKQRASDVLQRGQWHGWI